MAVGDGVTVTAARCGFMKNGEVGVFCGGAKNTKARLNDCTKYTTMDRMVWLHLSMLS